MVDLYDVRDALWSAAAAITTAGTSNIALAALKARVEELERRYSEYYHVVDVAEDLNRVVNRDTGGPK